MEKTNNFSKWKKQTTSVDGNNKQLQQMEMTNNFSRWKKQTTSVDGNNKQIQ